MIRVLIVALVGVVSYFCGNLFSNDPDPEKEKVIQRTVLNVLEQVHFDPADLNDEFSAEVYDAFLESMDGRKRFYTQEDLVILETYKLELDDQAHAGTLDFFDKAVELLDLRIADSQKLYRQILETPFDFSKNESYEFDPDKKEYPADHNALLETWRKILKYEVLGELEEKLSKQEKEGYEGEVKTLEELEKESRKKVLEAFDESYKSYEKIKRSDRFEAYLNAFTHVYDPHSDYYNPKEKQDFDISMGGKLEGIGARLRTEGDLTKVVSIVPGGPVWKDKQIEVNDFILAVTQKGEEPVDVTGWRIDDVVSMIRGKKGTYVILQIQKKDGTVIDVELERDVVNIADSFAKSAILDLPGTADQIGYIDLPKFYSSFEGPEGNSCAVDVSKEIEKLKSNNVNGIILDLRGNGGGSLRDVVDMSGLFIESGPIVQVKPRGRKPLIYKDTDKKVKWDGPLIVMVNSFSASASEILAAAMQDYNRAIIVGEQSFGKGTVQRFIDLDRAVGRNSNHKKLGSLKVTMQKFYRVDGGSTQLLGVKPDVVLPDRYSEIEVGEREYPNAMEWSELDALNFDQDVFKVGNMANLISSSEKRLENDPTFGLISEQAEWYKENREKTSYSLNLEEHRAYLKDKDEEGKKFRDIMKEPVEGLAVTNLPEDEEAINLDETTQARNEDWVKARTKDIYLKETLAIMRDLINGQAYTNIDRKSEEP